MADILSYLLFGLAVITGYEGMQVFKKDKKSKPGRIMVFCFFSSAWWSFFFGILLNRTDEEAAWVLRSVGMVGVFALLAGVIWLTAYWAETGGGWGRFCRWFPLLGFVILPFNIRRDAIIFKQAEFGMAYSFRPDFWSNAYSIYSISYAVILIVLVVQMYRNAKSRHRKRLAVHMIIGTLVTVVGMTLDTLLPMFGVGAFPGSTLGQAFSMLVFCGAYSYDKKTAIELQNMSRFIYDSAQEPMLIYNAAKELKIVNEAARVFFGFDEDDFEHYILSDLFEVDEEAIKSPEQGSRFEAACRWNEAYCSISIDRLYDEYHDIIGYIVVVNDLTEKRRVMKEMELARKRSEEANQAKSDFLASMSHEIRTPINAVLGMNEMILRESDQPEVTEYARQIKGAGQTLLSLINDILDFSKIESGKMELVNAEYNIHKLLDDVVQVISFRMQEKNLKLQLLINRKIPAILCGDELRVKQIVMNLMTNAVKYTQEGSVTLGVTYKQIREGEQPVIRLCFTVRDTGIGIRQENIPKLFEAFRRVDNRSVHHIEGTGLGLSIVKRFVEMMHGSIRVESTYGEGSTFYCEIEQTVAENADSTSAKQTTEWGEPFTAPGARILAVDDNRINLMVLKGLLKRIEAEVDTASGGRECLEMASKKKYHIILMDHMMPEMDGIETLHRLRELEQNESKDAVVVALTANAINGVREEYIRAGFTEYLSKPIDYTKLERILFDHLPKELIQKNHTEDGSDNIKK